MDEVSDRAVRSAIQKMTGTFDKDDVSIVMCNAGITDIDARTCTCTPVGGNAVSDIINVQLMAGGVNDGWFLIPTVGSIVIVCYSTKNDPYICLFSEIDNAYLIVNGKTQFQGGEYGGIPRVDVLITKINNLERLVNNLIAAYNGHSHILALTSGTGTAGPPTTEEAGIITLTTREEIENTTITHGP
jgi:hypothetical protein